LLKADGPIRAVCGDRVELMAVYEDGSRHSAAAVVKCSSPFKAPSTQELRPDVTTSAVVVRAASEAVNGLIGNLPYKVEPKISCDSSGATVMAKIQPLPYGSVTGAVAYDAKKCAAGSCWPDSSLFRFSTAPNGFIVSWGITRPYYYTFKLRFNYTAPSTSGLATDYQGEALSPPIEVELDGYVTSNGEYWYYMYWNGKLLAWCMYKAQIATEVEYEEVYKSYRRRVKPATLGANLTLQNDKFTIGTAEGFDVVFTEINGQKGLWAGIIFEVEWVDDDGKVVNTGYEIHYMPAQELYQGSSSDPAILKTLSEDVNYGTLTFSNNEVFYMVYSKTNVPSFGGAVDEGTYVHECIADWCRVYKYFNPTYFAGYRAYNVSRLLTFVQFRNYTAYGMGLGLQIPDLYFMTTFDVYRSRVNKTAGVSASIEGQPARVYAVEVYK